MEVNILAFGIARDIFSERKIVQQIAAGETVAGVMEQLKVNYPDLSKLKAVMLAVNEEYVDDNYQIKDGDELAIIPPVSGG